MRTLLSKLGEHCLVNLVNTANAVFGNFFVFAASELVISKYVMRTNDLEHEAWYFASLDIRSLEHNASISSAMPFKFEQVLRCSFALLLTLSSERNAMQLVFFLLQNLILGLYLSFLHKMQRSGSITELGFNVSRKLLLRDELS